MSEYDEGRTTVVVLDPDTHPENSPLRRALENYRGQVVTVWPEPAASRPVSAPASR